MLTSDSLIISVFKPSGWTSFDVVAKLRNLLRWKKVGHAGTLDPSAEGVLLVLFGAATRHCREFTALRKEYRAGIRFGIRTVTDDLDGDLLETKPVASWSVERIQEALNAMRGSILQIPPRVSAVKVAGKRSYARVRNAETFELKPRPVHIHALDLLAAEEPDITLNVVCSSGTYIRSIARDLGQSLGWGGVLASLTRTAIGTYRVENSLTIADIERRRGEFICG